MKPSSEAVEVVIRTVALKGIEPATLWMKPFLGVRYAAAGTLKGSFKTRATRRVGGAPAHNIAACMYFPLTVAGLGRLQTI